MALYATILSFVAGLQDRRNEKGVTAVEYAMVIGAVVIVVVAAAALLGPKLSTFVNGLSFGGSTPAAG